MNVKVLVYSATEAPLNQECLISLKNVNLPFPDKYEIDMKGFLLFLT